MKGVILLLFLIAICIAVFFALPGPPSKSPILGIKDIWYINLDRSVDRKKALEQELKKLPPMPVYRWKAVDGKDLSEKDIEALRIPNWSRPEFAPKDKEKQRANEIACFLSHRTLLEHLQTLSMNSQDGHLILEDDIKVLPNLVKKWNTGLQGLDDDWDMIFLGYSVHREIFQVKDNLGVPESLAGTYAYVVKHKSIPKILDTLQVIYDPIDEVYSREIGNLRILAFERPLVSPGKAKSTIRQ
jgi:GR25 family glycosyltransferase involved in LPS biosynthesis